MPRTKKSAKTALKEHKKGGGKKRPTQGKVAIRKGPESSSNTRQTKQGRMTGADFTREFDALCRDKKFTEAQDLLDSLQQIEKWQRLNFQAILEYNKGDQKKSDREFTQSKLL